MTSLLPNNAHIDYVLSLADIPPDDAERAGAKAAKLGELARSASSGGISARLRT